MSKTRLLIKALAEVRKTYAKKLAENPHTCLETMSVVFPTREVYACGWAGVSVGEARGICELAKQILVAEARCPGISQASLLHPVAKAVKSPT